MRNRKLAQECRSKTALISTTC